jgi:o-succinylbenzoate synthase
VIITGAEVYRYTLPLKRRLRLGSEEITARKGFLIRLTGAGVFTGWGEAAPLPGFSRESLEMAWNGLVRCARRLKNRPVPENAGQLEAFGLSPLLESRSVAFAIEGAVLNLRAAAKRMPLSRFLSRKAGRSLPLNALLDGDKRNILKKAATLADLDYRAAKLKVGRRRMAQDIELVHAVRETLGPGPRLRLDANRAWTLESAVTFGKAAAGCAIEYIEEPVRDPLDLPVFLERTGMPYALDETLQESGALLESAEGGADTTCHALACVFEKAHRLIWKPGIVHYPNIGGLTGGAAQRQSRIVVSGAFESGVGTAILAQYAAACCGPETPSGLDTYTWLAEDVLKERLPLDRGAVAVDKIQNMSERVDIEKLEPVWKG